MLVIRETSAIALIYRGIREFFNELDTGWTGRFRLGSFHTDRFFQPAGKRNAALAQTLLFMIS